MDIEVILVITSPLVYKRSSFTKPYSALCIPGSFLNLYIKQKVAVIGSISPIIFKKCLFISSVSCTKPFSYSHCLTPPTPHWVTYIKMQSQDTWLQLKHYQRLHYLRCCGTWQKHLYESLWNVQSKSLTQGQKPIGCSWKNGQGTELCSFVAGTPSACCRASVKPWLKWKSSRKRRI